MHTLPLGVLDLPAVRVYVPESFTTIDVIDLYLPAVRLGGTYPIPLGSVVLTIVHVHKAELIRAVDLIQMDQ